MVSDKGRENLKEHQNKRMIIPFIKISSNFLLKFLLKNIRVKRARENPQNCFDAEHFTAVWRRVLNAYDLPNPSTAVHGLPLDVLEAGR